MFKSYSFVNIILYEGTFSIIRKLKTLLEEELCVPAHLFAEEVSTESNLVGNKFGHQR